MARMVVTTTLFDLIAALQEDVESGAEDAVIATVQQLCTSGHLRFLNTLPDDAAAIYASA